MTASVTVSPRYDSASRFSFCRMKAEICWGLKSLPSRLIFQSVPMWRLTDRMVRSTLVTAWRLATSPTSTSPFLAKATTDGVVLAPSALVMTVGSPPSRTLTTELVVPRSMPTARAISIPPTDYLSGSDSRMHDTHPGVKGPEPLTLNLCAHTCPEQAILVWSGDEAAPGAAASTRSDPRTRDTFPAWRAAHTHPPSHRGIVLSQNASRRSYRHVIDSGQAQCGTRGRLRHEADGAPPRGGPARHRRPRRPGASPWWRTAPRAHWGP